MTGTPFPPLPGRLLGGRPGAAVGPAGGGAPNLAQFPRKTVESVRTNRPAEGTGGDSPGPGADLALALRLAAEAGEWSVVSALARQLDLLAAQQGTASLRVFKGGKAP